MGIRENQRKVTTGAGSGDLRHPIWNGCRSDLSVATIILGSNTFSSYTHPFRTLCTLWHHLRLTHYWFLSALWEVVSHRNDMVKQSSASRFSTLKVFNFTGSGSSGSKSQQTNNTNGAGGSEPPPPPPPKDRYFLYNKSMSSLSPESYAGSAPPTPLTPGFSRTSPGPSHSSVDLPGEFGAASLAAPSMFGSRSISGSSGEGSSGARAMKGFFGKIASKSKRAPRAAKSPLIMENVQSEATEDDGISMPWNFQVSVLMSRCLRVLTLCKAQHTC